MQPCGTGDVLAPESRGARPGFGWERKNQMSD